MKTPVSQSPIVHCACGRCYSAEAWREIPIAGHWVLGDEPALELRNCDCGTTLSRKVSDGFVKKRNA